VVVASLRDSLKLSRRRASLVCFVLLLALGLPSALSYTPLKASLMGLKVLDFMDLFFGSLGLILCATLISLAIGWSPCISLLWEEALRGSKIKLPGWYLRWFLRVAVPASLVFILVLSLLKL